CLHDERLDVCAPVYESPVEGIIPVNRCESGRFLQIFESNFGLRLVQLEYPIGSGNVPAVSIDQREPDWYDKRGLCVIVFLEQTDVKGLLIGVPESFGAHPWVADPVKPLFFELIEPPAGHLLKAFEKLIGICVLQTITREIKGLAGFELFLSDQQAEHADNF